MLHHHTDNLAQKAADIADREAEKIWQQTHDFNQYTQTWLQVYQNVLREFQPEPVSL